MKRQIITINETKCNGCGLCVPDCPEGALQVIDGKARLVGDLLCDGLGACLGRCPEGAISIEEREAEPYNEFAVMENIAAQGKGTVIAHLKHLHNHGQDTFYRQALEYLVQNGYDIAEFTPELATAKTAHPALDLAKLQQMVHGQIPHHAEPSSCPGSRSLNFTAPVTTAPAAAASGESALTHWPIQMHLMNPRAPHFTGADFLLAADCTAFALGSFHPEILAGRKLGIACPKLDSNKEIYVDKLVALIDDARINTLTVAIMEVPCCGGLSALAEQAVARAQRRVPLKQVVIGIEGDIISDEWL